MLLSERLRDNKVASETDLGHLEEVLLESNSALEDVAVALRQIGLEPTTRLKTSATIIDKLRRQPHLSLASIRDLAGARIVRPMTLDEQDGLADQIKGIWPDATVIDRRIDPSYGYRAVHVVPRLNRCSVEIQLRTIYQDIWAQAMEAYGDRWGREIRYGGDPLQPDDPVSTEPGSLTRRQIIDFWKGLSEPLFQLAQLENLVARARCEEPSAENQLQIDAQEAEIDSRFRYLKDLVKDVRAALEQSNG